MRPICRSPARTRAGVRVSPSVAPPRRTSIDSGAPGLARMIRTQCSQERTASPFTPTISSYCMRPALWAAPSGMIRPMMAGSFNWSRPNPSAAGSPPPAISSMDTAPRSNSSACLRPAGSTISSPTRPPFTVWPTSASSAAGQVATARPSTATISCPAARPAAPAGEPGRTSPTIGRGPLTPMLKIRK